MFEKQKKIFVYNMGPLDVLKSMFNALIIQSVMLFWSLPINTVYLSSEATETNIIDRLPDVTHELSL